MHYRSGLQVAYSLACLLSRNSLLCRASGSCADEAWAPDMEAVQEGNEEGSPEKKTLAEMSALSFRPAMPASPPATLTQVRTSLPHLFAPLQQSYCQRVRFNEAIMSVSEPPSGFLPGFRSAIQADCLNQSQKAVDESQLCCT